MKRTHVLAGAGLVVALVGLVVLWQVVDAGRPAPAAAGPSLRTQSGPPVPPRATGGFAANEPGRAPVPVEPTLAVRGEPAAAAGRPGALPREPVLSPTTVRADDPAAPRSFRQRLQLEIKATEPELAKCLEKHGGTGAPLTGRIQLTTIVAHPGAQAGAKAGTGASAGTIVEKVGYDYDESTIHDEELLSCMSQTGSAMHVDALPAGVDAVSIGRVVILRDGKIIEHSLTEYANLRDDDPGWPASPPTPPSPSPAPAP